MTWIDFLKWVLLSGGAGVLAYFVMGKVPELESMNPEPKRYMSWLIAAGFACTAFSLMVLFGYEEVPANGQVWFEQLFFYAALAITASQTTHARRDLSKG
jgi:hypothetical protein